MACGRVGDRRARIATRVIHRRCAQGVNRCSQPLLSAFSRHLRARPPASPWARVDLTERALWSRQARRHTPLVAAGSYPIVADHLPEESPPPAVNPDLAHIWPAIQSELK